MDDSLPFLDTNILLRHLVHDHPNHSPRATAYLARIEAGEIRVRTAESVIFETVFTLQRYYKLSKAEICERVLPVVLLPGIVLPGKQRLRAVFEIYVDQNVSFIDASHAVLMRHLGIQEIVSFDEGYDRIAGIRRIEP